MARNPKKETRPSTTPLPIRFTLRMLKDIEEVAEMFGMSRQDIIRLSVAAGLKTMHRLGRDGLAKLISDFAEDEDHAGQLGKLEMKPAPAAPEEDPKPPVKKKP